MRAFGTVLLFVCLAGFVVLTTLAILGAFAALFGALAGFESIKTIGATVSGFSAFVILASMFYFSEWISAMFRLADMGAPSPPPQPSGQPGSQRPGGPSPPTPRGSNSSPPASPLRATSENGSC